MKERRQAFLLHLGLFPEFFWHYPENLELWNERERRERTKRPIEIVKSQGKKRRTVFSNFNLGFWVRGFVSLVLIYGFIPLHCN